MDDFVREKLREWQLLQSLEEIFEENQIDEEAFLLLDESTVKEMIRPVGPRAKFWKKIQDLKAEENPEPSSLTSHVVGVSAIPSCSSPSTSTISSPGPSPPSTPRGAFSPSTSRHVSPELTPTGPPLKKFRANFSVRKYLSEEVGDVGRDIVGEIEAGALSRRLRLEMVRILVAYLINQYGDRPKGDIKLGVAQSIVGDFPSLKDSEGGGYEAWFTPGTGRHSASGWLEERLRNVRRGPSRKSNTVPPPRPRSQMFEATLPEVDIDEEEFQGMKEWLLHNLEPLEKVKEYMGKTAVMRATKLKKSDEPLAMATEEFPRLFDIPGMVEADFRLIFPNVAEKMFLKWTPAFAERVLRYASLQRNWARQLGINEEKLDTDAKKVAISLQLLPAILPCGKKRKRLATVQTALGSYVDVQPLGTNMPRYLENVSRSQPYILLLGDREAPQGVFVVAGGKALPQPSVLKAVDGCFKMFYLLDLHYPWEAATTWEFHQRVVYGIGSGVGATTPEIISMRASVDNAH